MDGNGTAKLPPIQRDIRIDLVRGLALLFIFVDHNAFLDERSFGWLSAFTLGRYSFIDAADVFFFISGYVSGLIYTNILLSKGMVACVRKALKRCIQLYIAEIVLLLVCLTLILTAPLHDTNPAWWAFHRLRDFPGDTLRSTLTLGNPPPFFDLLPIYIFFIGLTPAAIWLWIRRPFLLALISLGLYVTALSAPGHLAYVYAGSFNPLAWQLVFFGGTVLGAGKILQPQRSWNIHPRMIVFAACGLTLIAFVRLSSSQKFGSFLHAHTLLEIAPLPIAFTGKTNLEPLRLVNLFLWVIVIGAVRPTCRIIRNTFSQMLMVCGRNSLMVFCASIFFNYVVLIYSGAASGGKILQFAWVAIGCGLLVGTAYGWMFLKKCAPDALQLPRIRTAITPRFRQFLLVIFAIWQGLHSLIRGYFDT
jgi:hypothetical protein